MTKPSATASRKRATPLARRRILDAAQEILRREGSGGLTLEAVARQAGVSRGGLLYHFPTMEELAGAVVEDCLKHFDSVLQSLMEIDDDPPGRFTRAYVVACAADSRTDDSRRAMLATLLHYASIFAQRRQQAAPHWRLLDDDQLEPVTAAIIRLAADGLWFDQVFGRAPLSEEMRSAVVERLLSWTTSPETLGGQHG